MANDQHTQLDENSPDVADAAAMLALAQRTGGRTARALEPDVRLVLSAWGLAWLIGFLLFYLAGTTARVSTGQAAAALFVLLVVALAITMVTTVRRTAGLRGVSQRMGAQYGWAWLLGFTTLFAVMAGAARTGLPEDTALLLWPVLSGLVVGLLYLMIGTALGDRLHYGLGAWILIASGAGAVAGYPSVYLVMALAGGGGFLIGALVEHVRLSRG